MKKDHQYHHVRPKHLGIIITPIFPVRIYECFFICLLWALLGKRWACGLNCGIVLGQLTMDLVHVLYHCSRWWWLECGRFYHNYHHFREETVAHGLTCSFWDFVFGTLPDSKAWMYSRYPWLRVIHLPFPLLDFVIAAALCRLTEDQKPSSPCSSKMSKTVLLRPPKLAYMVTSLLSCLCAPCIYFLFWVWLFELNLCCWNIWGLNTFSNTQSNKRTASIL